MAEARAKRAVNDPADPDEAARALGARIRVLRKARGATLTEIAAEAQLSHSFLSQVERGLERLSMTSLFRVAQALGTTQQALLTEQPRERSDGGFHLFRRQDDSAVDTESGPVHVMAPQSGRFVPMIMIGPFSDDGLWWEHAEDEFVYVLEGALVVVLEDAEHELRAGDATYYEGFVRHKWRTPAGETSRVVVVKEQHRS
ncbi:helix-turn-helix domain-containing protein [Microbacterium xanthum]|uniref:helix-turn-helix domain-containing protein n=1 Tax=Microbacterium xanthum TaxID=3079794 RepID=UPI002AD33E18|nr:XRE family transcriptional regulator [Microbacterium sp. KSW-48]MDZ8170970.1 XRE family transcriptional regulator [Microbacterium sp. KSW-48]